MSAPLQENRNQRRQAILAEETPILPAAERRRFAAAYFERRHRYLAACRRAGGPLYLQEAQVLKTRADQFRRAFKAELPASRCYYAVKSNNHPNISRVLHESGFGLDVSSGLELELALAVGSREIVFSGPGKTDRELRLAVERADRVVLLIDSFGELDRLAALTAERPAAIRCGVRLSVSQQPLWRKFGIAPEELPAFWERARRITGIDLVGLQFHTSWNLDPQAQSLFIETLSAIVSDMPPEFRTQLEFVDVGGGYWPEAGEWLLPESTPAGILKQALGWAPDPAAPPRRLAARPITEFAAQIGRAAAEHLFPALGHSCTLCFEPGRWICHDAVHLLMSVIDRKAPDLVITDAGTNAVGWERFEHDYFPVLNLSRPALTERRCHILGALCTPHDVWGRSYFGDDIRPGDILMIPSQGAYTYSLRQHFIKPLPEVLMIQ